MNQYKCFIMAIFMVVLSMTISICSCEADITVLQNLQMKKEIESSNIVSGPQEVWNKTYGGNKWDECSAVEVTADDGYIFAGTRNANGYDNSGDCWLLKTDSYGNISWEKTYGGQGSETGTDICKTSDGGYAIIGYTRTFGAGGSDVYLIKTNATGNEQWNKTFGGTQDDYGLAIQNCRDEGFIIAGATLSYGSREAWLIKTDVTGTMQWQKRFCSENPPGGYFMTVVRNTEEEYVAAGRNYIGDTSQIIVVKTNEDGTVLWEKLFGGSNTKEAALGMAATSDGNYIITGQVENQETEHDILLMKINDNGDIIWTRTFNETVFFDTGLSVEETSDGGFLIAGEVGTNLNNPVLFNAILIKTDLNGIKEWSIMYGKTGSESFYEALQTQDGGYIAGGFTTSYGTGSQDAWLIKIGAFENQRPNTPSKPSGPSSGKINQEYMFTTLTTDPDGDQLFYLFDFGDDVPSFWDGPYDSGEECNTSHIWIKQGSYQVKVKARDSNGAESDWSDPLTVTNTKSRDRVFNSPFVQFFEKFFRIHSYLFQMFQKLQNRLG